MNNIFLGKSSAKIKKWIKDHSGPDLSIPLCFEAVDAGATIALKCNGNNLKTATFQTSTDRQNWTDYTYGTNITLAKTDDKTDKVYFRAKADNTSIVRDYYNYLQFTTTQAAKKVNVSGNVMSLLAPEFSSLIDLSTIRSGNPGTYQFYRVFYLCKNINDCSNLNIPATTLAGYCYSEMFSDCMSLTQAPELSATTLANNCYHFMFYDCSSLTQAPAIKTYTPKLFAFNSMLGMFDYITYGWSLTSCNWPDLTLSEAESMVLGEYIFGYDDNPGEDVRISITCKDG